MTNVQIISGSYQMAFFFKASSNWFSGFGTNLISHLCISISTEDEQFEADKAQVVKEIQALKKENTS